MTKYQFPCGCEFDIVEDKVKNYDDLPSLNIDYYNIPLDCPITWQLIQSGKTKGMFQIETNLGKKWSKELSPTKIDELSALVSIMRPGVLKSMIDGKSITQKYCDRKNNKEEVEHFHPSLEPILQDTYSLLLFQEQSMKIAQELAGFSLEEADSLRKAIGKKLPELMAKIKTQFIEGCSRVGKVNIEEAEQIFGWIQESQRYQFNESHSVSYGTIGYWTAYAKAHFPLHFFTACLSYSNEKLDPQREMQQLISDTKNFDITVLPPSLKQLHSEFSINNNKIYFGLENIKGLGKSTVEKLLTNVEQVELHLKRKISNWTWYDFLTLFSDNVGQTTVNNLIAVGAMDYMGHNRSYKIHQYNEWKKLTNKEREWIKNNCQKQVDLITSMELLLNGHKISVTRKPKVIDILNNLKKPSFSVLDDSHFVASHEQELLGIPLTCTKLDACHTNIVPNSTCKEFLDGKTGKISLCVEIINVSEYIIKQGKSKGQKMLFLQVEDDSGVLESVTIFPNIISGNEAILICGSTVFIEGKRDDYRKNSLVINRIIPI